MFTSYYLTKSACDARLQLKQSRKLRMLCLHGYNTDASVMEYQMRHFRQVFHEVMEFTVVDAPFESNEEPPKEEHQPEGAEANQYQVYFYDSKEMVKLKKNKVLNCT